jgi:dGTPase
VVKHNGPLLPLAEGAGLPPTTAAFRAVWDLDLDGHPGLEAQLAALADDIAYTNHDIEDALRAGLLVLDDLAALPLVGPVLAAVRAAHPGLESGRIVHETTRRVIDRMVTDLLAETRRRLAASGVRSAAEVRRAGAPLAAFSPALAADLEIVRAFMFRRVYRATEVNRETSKARRIVRDLFAIFAEEPNTLPGEWRDAVEGGAPEDRPRLVADYIAGMTDRYARLEHQRLFDLHRRF